MLGLVPFAKPRLGQANQPETPAQNYKLDLPSSESDYGGLLLIIKLGEGVSRSKADAQDTA